MHEVAAELGVDVKIAMRTMRELGEFVKGPSSSIEPPVARRLRAAIIAKGLHPIFPALDGDGGRQAGLLADGLPRRLPSLVDLLLDGYTPGADLTDIFSQAAFDRWFYFVPARAHEAVTRAADAMTEFHETSLPTPRGIAVVMESGETTVRPVLTAWAIQESALRVATLTLHDDGTGRVSVTGMRHWSLSRDESGFATRGQRHLQRLAAMWSIVPDRAPSQPNTPDRTPANQRPEPVPTEETRVIYATRAVLGLDSRGEGQGAARSGRWSVRGHWRNQWHPSTKAHKRIWIHDHTAGAVDAEPTKRERVYVIAPRDIN